MALSCTLNKQFQDQDTGKSREIDVYGWRSMLLKEFRRKVGKLTFCSNDMLDVRIVIECKANSTPMIFFSSQDHSAYKHVTFGGYPRMAWEWDNDCEPPEICGRSLDDILDFKKFHSNWKSSSAASRFAKLISKKHGHKTEWELEHTGIYPSVDKLCRATHSIYLEEKRSAIDPPKDEANEFHLCLVYPVLLFSGELFECRVAERNYTIRRIDHVFLDWSLEGQTIKAPFRIAVIRERYLETYLKIISQDIEGVIAAA
jgi:hypothetical protein